MANNHVRTSCNTTQVGGPRWSERWLASLGWGGRGEAILSNTAYLSAARVAQLLVGFTVGVYVARYLGPARWGLLAYAVSFAALFTSIASLGLDSIVVRELAARDPTSSASEEILSAAFVLRLLASPLTFAVIAVSSLIARHDPATRTLVLVAASGVFFQPLSVVDLYFQSRVLSKYVVYVQAITLTATSAARVALVCGGAPLIAFALVSVADVALSMLGILLVYRLQRGRIWPFRSTRTLCLRLLADAWPLALTGVLTSILVNVDCILVKEILGAESAGKYATVVNIGTAIYFVPIALGQSVFPVLVEARRDPDLYQRCLQQLFDVLFWAAIAVALPTSLFAEPLMAFLYGAAYAGAGAALAIHVWSATAVFLGIVTSHWLVAENLQRIYPVRILGSLCTSVALNWLLLPSWGIRGAAIATIGAQLVSSTVIFAFSPLTRLMPRMQLKAVLLPFRLWSARVRADRRGV